MTLLECIEQQSARLTQAGVSFGHGTTNAFDEAVWLALWRLGLPLDDLDGVAQRKLTARELAAIRFGNVLQIDLDSLHRYQDLRPGRGRPRREDSAWAALNNAEPRSIDDLKLLSVGMRRRARRRRVRILPGSINRLLADKRVVISGATAAAHHGAAVQDRPPHAIYVRRSDYPALASEYRLKEGGDANLIVRVAPDDSWIF